MFLWSLQWAKITFGVIMVQGEILGKMTLCIFVKSTLVSSLVVSIRSPKDL